VLGNPIAQAMNKKPVMKLAIVSSPSREKKDQSSSEGLQ
jgi:hypothetical protein